MDKTKEENSTVAPRIEKSNVDFSVGQMKKLLVEAGMEAVVEALMVVVVEALMVVVIEEGVEGEEVVEEQREEGLVEMETIPQIMERRNKENVVCVMNQAMLEPSVQ